MICGVRFEGRARATGRDGRAALRPCTRVREPRVEALGVLRRRRFRAPDRARQRRSLPSSARRPRRCSASAATSRCWCRTVAFELGVEPELRVHRRRGPATASTAPRDSYFAPVFGYRGSLILRLRRAARGARSTRSSAAAARRVVVDVAVHVERRPIRSCTTASARRSSLGGGWQLRLDARQGFMPATRRRRDRDLRRRRSASACGSACRRSRRRRACHRRRGRRRRRRRIPIAMATASPIASTSARTSPRPSTASRTTTAAPSPIPTATASSAAPTSARPRPRTSISFQDEDGCPDPDNDSDGIPDAQDKCPNEPETKNGYRGRRRLSGSRLPAIAGRGVRDRERGAVRAGARAADRGGEDVARRRCSPSCTRIRRCTSCVIGHPDEGRCAKTEALAKKRAEASSGTSSSRACPSDQLESMTGDVRKQPIDLAAAPPTPH